MVIKLNKKPIKIKDEIYIYLQGSNYTESFGVQWTKFDKTQIKKKFKHSPDFNIKGSPSSGQIPSYQDKLQQHVNSEKIVIIAGTYRKAPVVHYLDPESKVNVIADTNGRFVSGWKLNDAQFENVKSRGSL